MSLLQKFIAFLSALSLAMALWPWTSAMAGMPDVHARIDQDVDAGKPLVVHVVVALADNEHQGIVPISASLGNGDRPDQNLYWGARFGVRTWFARQKTWQTLPAVTVSGREAIPGILDQRAFQTTMVRAGKTIPVIVYAEAWRGAEIQTAIERFLALAAGAEREILSWLPLRGTTVRTVATGGDAHLIAFIGHNGLMDFSLPWPPTYRPRRDAAASLVLACFSREYFAGILSGYGSTPVLLTEGLMAPEAYTLEAAIRSLAQGSDAAALELAAAKAYDQYQHCGLKAAQRLFWSPAMTDPAVSR